MKFPSLGSKKKKITLEDLQEIERASLESIKRRLEPYYIPDVQYDDDDKYQKLVSIPEFKKSYPNTIAFESKDERYYLDYVTKIVAKEFGGFIKSHSDLDIGAGKRKRLAGDIIEDIIETESEELKGLFTAKLILV